MEQWILFSVVIAALLALVGLLVYKSLRTDYPEGNKHTMKWRDYKINLITHKKVLPLSNEVRKATLCAVQSVVLGYKSLKDAGYTVSGSVDLFKEYNIYIIPAELMPRRTAGLAAKYDGIPTAIIADDVLHNIVKIGEPIIHETCHHVLNDIRGDLNDHADETIWMESGGDYTLQYEARKVYKELALKFGV